MFAIFTTSLLALWSKARVTILAWSAAVLLLAAFVWRVFAAGAASEKLHNANETISRYRKEARIEATVRSLGADAARKRLRDKWQKR